MKWYMILLLMQSLQYGTGFIPQLISVDVVLYKEEVEETGKIIKNGGKEIYYQKEMIYFDNIPILLEGISQTQLELYQSEYYSLPTQLKNSISKITFTSSVLNQVCGISSLNKVKGCARSEYNDIVLDSEYRFNDLLHESIHLYSYQNERVFSDEFNQIYEEEGSRIPVQVGNIHNIYEYYVSAYLLYLLPDDHLMNICPKTKQYFDRT